MRQVAAFRKVSAFTFALMLHPAEVGTHFISQAGESVQQLGIVLEHLIVLGILVDDIMIDLTP